MPIGEFTALLLSFCPLATASWCRGPWWRGCRWPCWEEKWSAWRCGEGGKNPFSLCQTGELRAAASASLALRARTSQRCPEPRAALGAALQTGCEEGGLWAGGWGQWEMNWGMYWAYWACPWLRRFEDIAEWELWQEDGWAALYGAVLGSEGGEDHASLWLWSPPCWGGRRGTRLGEAVRPRRCLSSSVVAPSVAAGAILQAKLPFDWVTDLQDLWEALGKRRGGGQGEGSWGIIGEVLSAYKICQFFLFLKRVTLFLR